MLDQRSDGARRSLWQYSLVGLVIGAVLLGVLLVIGFPEDLWTPSGGGELFRAFLTAGLIFCGALALIGPAMYVEDAEARRPALPSLSPRVSRVSVTAGPIVWVGLGLVVCAVLVIRYIYLIVIELGVTKIS
jgi:hypothetical protein